jgi:predicted nuclease of predicted toxin-antitoxin system
VKVLFDHNLSPHLVEALRDVYLDSVHVKDVALDRATDDRIWNYAKEHGLTIVSKDSDFHQRSLVEGCPPKVVWIQRGNCSTAEIETLLRGRVREVAAFDAHPEAAFLELE